MDGLFHGKPYEQMDDLGVPNSWKHPYGFHQQEDIQGCGFGPESSRHTLVSPIFRSSLIPSVADSFRDCIGDKSATLIYNRNSVTKSSPQETANCLTLLEDPSRCCTYSFGTVGGHSNLCKNFICSFRGSTRLVD